MYLFICICFNSSSRLLFDRFQLIIYDTIIYAIITSIFNFYCYRGNQHPWILTPKWQMQEMQLSPAPKAVWTHPISATGFKASSATAAEHVAAILPTFSAHGRHFAAFSAASFTLSTLMWIENPASDYLYSVINKVVPVNKMTAPRASKIA